MSIHRRATIAAALTVVVLLAAYVAWSHGYLVLAENDDDEEGAARLSQSLKSAGVSPEAGLSASEREGTPISEKFEVEEGKFQLSVYAQKGDKSSEVILDPKSGKIAKADPITGGEDLADAKVQSEAMASAKRPLRAAVEDAVTQNANYRAVSVIPALKDGHPIANVTLLKGEEFRTVPEAEEAQPMRPRSQSRRPGSRKDEHPVAAVTVAKGEEFKTISEKLD